MKPSAAILIACDRYPIFREALRNFLLTAGYTRVDVADGVREALTLLRNGSYRFVLIGLGAPLAKERLARVTRHRQPEAKVLILVSADRLPEAPDASFTYVIRERASSILLQLLAENE